MEQLPANFSALLALVFALGMRHGFDPDHLATIDGLTRFNAAAQRRISRWCGFLFSLGHGVIVMAVAIGVGVLAQAWQVPLWLEDAGAWISIVFLALLGFLNLRQQTGQVSANGSSLDTAAKRPSLGMTPSPRALLPWPKTKLTALS